MADDANDGHLSERCVAESRAYAGNFLQVRRDTVVLPSGEQATREYIVHPGAVMVVPLLDDGRAVLERQYRYPLSRVTVEFPAGKIDPHEAALTCAARELAEETGYRAAQWAYACTTHNAAAYSTEGIEIWFARGLRAGAQALDHGEFIETFAASLEQMEAWVREGVVTDAKSMIGVMWWRQWRNGTWDLPWRDAPAAGGAA
jgi:ADP-ribose pyrophosphatase